MSATFDKQALIITDPDGDQLTVEPDPYKHADVLVGVYEGTEPSFVTITAADARVLAAQLVIIARQAEERE